MLLTVAMGLLLQGPQDMKDWVDRGYDGSQPNASVVAGAPELSREEAWVSATRRAVEERQGHIERLATDQASAQSPAWLPEFVRERVVRQWTGEQMRSYRLRVLDRDLLVRDHGFGRSYQAFLLLEKVNPDSARLSDALSNRLQSEQERFVLNCGGVVGWWGLLALIVLWIDRLTRGYMTGRLYVLGTGLGLVVPILLVIF